MSDELEELKRKRLEQLKEQQQEQIQEEAQLEQQIQQLEAIVKQYLTKEALERYGNIKTAQPDKAVQVLAILGQLIQTGRVQKVDDHLFKEILLKITPKKREFKITRK